jgi:hypothetical protein
MDDKNINPETRSVQNPKVPNPPLPPPNIATTQPPPSPIYNAPATPVLPKIKSKRNSNEIKTTARNVIRYIAGFIEVILVIRFVFKLLGANAGNSFVKLVYNVTNVFSGPFNNVFGVTHATASNTHIFDPTIILAAIVYALIAWGLIKLININHKY